MLKNKQKSNPDHNAMRFLAQLTELNFDNQGEDLLYAKIIFTNSLDMNESDYKEMEDDISKYELKGEGFEIYAWNDSSGYQYWNLKQEEDNYIQITVAITDIDKINPEELKQKAQQAFDYFLKYSRH